MCNLPPSKVGNFENKWCVVYLVDTRLTALPSERIYLLAMHNACSDVTRLTTESEKLPHYHGVSSCIIIANILVCKSNRHKFYVFKSEDKLVVSYPL